MIRYTLKAKCLSVEGTCDWKEEVFTLPYPETHACLKSRMFDTLEARYVSIVLLEVKEELL